MKTAIEILKTFANNSDPVYDARVRADQVRNCPKMLSMASVKMCSLCGAHGQHNEENLRHEAGCVWMEARQFVKQHDLQPLPS